MLLEQSESGSSGTGHVLRLRADAVAETSMDEDLASLIRASFLLAGPLLARFGEAAMPPPGGDSSAAGGSTPISTRSVTSGRG